jgi:hypothetical protein
LGHGSLFTCTLPLAEDAATPKGLLEAGDESPSTAKNHFTPMQ